jgi:hypothetical protein
MLSPSLVECKPDKDNVAAKVASDKEISHKKGPNPTFDPSNFQCYKGDYDTFIIDGGNFNFQPYYCKNKSTLEIVDNSYCSGTDNGCEIRQGCNLGTDQIKIYKTGPNKRVEVSSRYDAGCEGLISQAAQIQKQMDKLQQQQVGQPYYRPPAATEWYGNAYNDPGQQYYRAPALKDNAMAEKAAAEAAENAAKAKVAADRALAKEKAAAAKIAAEKAAADKAAAAKIAAEKAAADKVAADKAAAEQAKIDGIVNRYIARPREQCYFTGKHEHQINIRQKPRYQDCVYECHENNLRNNREIECMGVVYSKDRFCYLNGFRPHVPDWATTGKLRCRYVDAEDSYLDDNAINRGWLNASDLRVT